MTLTGVSITTKSASTRVLARLKQYGILLQTDACLPNVCALVAGEPVHGSWWAHPRSHDIFRVNCELAAHPEVLVTKLISGKVTYVERALWSAVIAIGCAREAWQMARLSQSALDLLGKMDHKRVETDRAAGEAASALEKRLLVHSEQFHSEAGAHARRLQSWDHWMRQTGLTLEPVSPETARRTLEKVVESLNRKFHGHGCLPWQAEFKQQRARKTPRISGRKPPR